MDDSSVTNPILCMLERIRRPSSSDVPADIDVMKEWLSSFGAVGKYLFEAGLGDQLAAKCENSALDKTKRRRWMLPLVIMLCVLSSFVSVMWWCMDFGSGKSTNWYSKVRYHS